MSPVPRAGLSETNVVSLGAASLLRRMQLLRGRGRRGAAKHVISISKRRRRHPSRRTSWSRQRSPLAHDVASNPFADGLGVAINPLAETSCVLPMVHAVVVDRRRRSSDHGCCLGTTRGRSLSSLGAPAHRRATSGSSATPRAARQAPRITDQTSVDSGPHEPNRRCRKLSGRRAACTLASAVLPGRPCDGVHLARRSILA